MPRPPLRIGILECDTPLPNTQSQYQSYGGVFESLLRCGATRLPHPSPLEPFDTTVAITKYAVEQDLTDYPSLSDVDAILITGSRHDSFADNDWTNKLVEFTAEVLKQDRVRLIGVCFGHQIIGRAMGVKVGRNEAGWEAAVTEVGLTERGKEVLGIKGDTLVSLVSGWSVSWTM